eukprot:833837-Rhodomonas_salina.1
MGLNGVPTASCAGNAAPARNDATRAAVSRCTLLNSNATGCSARSTVLSPMFAYRRRSATRVNHIHSLAHGMTEGCALP